MRIPAALAFVSAIVATGAPAYAAPDPIGDCVAKRARTIVAVGGYGMVHYNDNLPANLRVTCDVEVAGQHYVVTTNAADSRAAVVTGSATVPDGPGTVCVTVVATYRLIPQKQYHACSPIL